MLRVAFHIAGQARDFPRQMLETSVTKQIGESYPFKVYFILVNYHLFLLDTYSASTVAWVLPSSEAVVKDSVFLLVYE